MLNKACITVADLVALLLMQSRLIRAYTYLLVCLFNCYYKFQTLLHCKYRSPKIANNLFRLWVKFYATPTLKHLLNLKNGFVSKEL